MPFKLIEAEKLYEKDPKLKKQDVTEIQSWLKKQTDLQILEDTQVLFFLYKNHYEIETSKTSIRNFFITRHACPEIFVALEVELLKITTSATCIIVLPKKTPEGYAIILLKLLDTRITSYNSANCLNLINMAIALYSHENGFVNGFVALFDMQGYSFGHLLKINLRCIIKALRHLQKGAPIKLKGLHIMNAVPLTGKIITLLKPFLGVKIYKKIQCHFPNSDTLYKFLPREYLCEEYGGELPSCRVLNEQSLQNMLDKYDFYVWHNSQKFHEKIK